jgi:3-methylcrotonyl-CoA carboxylase alpha subunit
MIESLLVANRGEIARRIFRTARRMRMRTVAVFTEADRTWPHWREADDAVLIGDGPASESYLSIDRIIEAARQSGVEAVHPGYGFLSENAAFAAACEAAGLVFVGPPASAIRAMGSKAEAKAIMTRAGVPVVPGYNGERQEPEFLKQKAYEIGYPVLIKAVSGGGGRGMRRVDRVLDFEPALAAARREALSAFGDDRVLVERYVERPRHIEVQVFADGHGNVVHLFERDCSVQRRHQKVVEEAPAPGLSAETRRVMGAAAVKAAAAVGYRGAGTVEFIADTSRGLRPDAFFFMEMNTRLQVEHPVTEEVTGLDLVEWQLRVAAGEALPLSQGEIGVAGHAIEVRVYAEDPGSDFRPSTGRLWAASFPSGPGVRVDAGVEAGSEVGPFYDSMLAKVIATGGDRAEALGRVAGALQQVRIAGPKTNLAFLLAIIGHPDFAGGGVDTGFIEREMDGLVVSPVKPGAVAGAVEEHLRREAGRLAAPAPGPWARTDGFELGGVQRRWSTAVRIDGNPATAEIAWDAAGPRVVRLGEADPGRSMTGDVVWAGRSAFILDGGGQTEVSFPDPLARDPERGEAGGDVVAPMTGRVATVAVKPGDRVEKGALLFTLEAMKMEHSVLAPLAGTVSAIQIVPGAQVAQGAPAVAIEAAETEAQPPVE